MSDPGNDMQELNEKAGDFLLKNKNLITLVIILLVVFVLITFLAFLLNYYNNIELIKEYAGKDVCEICFKTAMP